MTGARYLTTKEACAYLHVSERKLSDLKKTAGLPYMDFAGQHLHDPAKLDRWLLRYERNAEAAR